MYLTKDARLRPRRCGRCTRGWTSGARSATRADPTERLWRSDLGLADRAGEADVSASARTPATSASCSSAAAPRSRLAIFRRLALERPVWVYLLGRDRARLDGAARLLQDAGCVSGGVAVADADDLDAHDAVIAARVRRGRRDSTWSWSRSAYSAPSAGSTPTRPRRSR